VSSEDSEDDKPLRIKIPAIRKRALSSDEEVIITFGPSSDPDLCFETQSDTALNLKLPPRKVSKTVASTSTAPALTVDKVSI
jgi:hypothetical protein